MKTIRVITLCSLVSVIQIRGDSNINVTAGQSVCIVIIPFGLSAGNNYVKVYQITENQHINYRISSDSFYKSRIEKVTKGDE